MSLLVEELSDDAAEIELTEERIQTMAESRLRAARLFTSTTPADTYLLEAGCVGAGVAP